MPVSSICASAWRGVMRRARRGKPLPDVAPTSAAALRENHVCLLTDRSSSLLPLFTLSKYAYHPAAAHASVQRASHCSTCMRFPRISVVDVHKSFGTLEVLKGVSFDVPPRQPSSA